MVKNVSEWDIFSRIEKLEELEPTLKDAFILAEFAFLRGFATTVQQSGTPKKDLHRVIAKLKELELSTDTLKRIGSQLILIYKAFGNR